MGQHYCPLRHPPAQKLHLALQPSKLLTIKGVSGPKIHVWTFWGRYLKRRNPHLSLAVCKAYVRGKPIPEIAFYKVHDSCIFGSWNFWNFWWLKLKKHDFFFRPTKTGGFFKDVLINNPGGSFFLARSLLWRDFVYPNPNRSLPFPSWFVFWGTKTRKWMNVGPEKGPCLPRNGNFISYSLWCVLILKEVGCRGKDLGHQQLWDPWVLDNLQSWSFLGVSPDQPPGSNVRIR